MIRFNCDYCEGAHERILNKLVETNMEQTPGYGNDRFCAEAAQMIRDLCKKPEAAVHFLTGGTQANLTVIAAALRPHQGVLCSEAGHIAVHEAGAVEATGHKVLGLSAPDGKITAQQVKQAYVDHINDESYDQIVKPGLVYISQSTELGTTYSKAELEEMYRVCKECGLYLYVDGARLAYALGAEGMDVDFEVLAANCDVFYIGGTKVGALFGEAVVILNDALKTDFRYIMRQEGGLVAKGRLLGIQFSELLRDGFYIETGRRADRLADEIRKACEDRGYPFLVPNNTNQIFPVIPDAVLESWKDKYAFAYQCRVDESHSAVRFCTSWATRPEDVKALADDIRNS
ncbi:threonine aldolase family protein [Enterocloster lavalensis]|uniref:threonine aldolase family protein n=1 Tax=Enterocloster lavalensis TaxID=460384 RepID=UPI0023F3F396|nr:aminotransferase class I/II-fold pyridoxal phosphate-dependent enzyme [Enterocloster lavalensis]